MSSYDVRCPICGHMNQQLDLEETDGWMECSKCGNTVQILEYAKTVKIPVYKPEQLTRMLTAGLRP